MKAFANTALGHFVVGLLSVVALTAINYVSNDPSAAAFFVHYGIPTVVVKFIFDLIRTNVPNI